MAISKYTLYKYVKVDGTWRYCKAAYRDNGKIKPDIVSFTDDFGLRQESIGSALPKFPSSVSDGGWFRGFTGSLLAAACRVACPPAGSDRAFRPANGDFYSRACGESVTLLAVGYNYGGNGALPPMGLSPTGTSASIAARALSSPTTCLFVLALSG